MTAQPTTVLEVGCQTPTREWIPVVGSVDLTWLHLAIKFNHMCGLPELAPWQKRVLGDWLGERMDGQWLASEWTLIVPRQNGKTHLAILRLLFGLLILKERNIVFTTHNFGVTRALMDEIRKIIAASEKLTRALVVSGGNGTERITTRDGRGTLRFKARTKHGPRGLSRVDLMVYDEAFLLDYETLEAFGYTQAASRNPQALFLSSAGDTTSTLLLDRRRALHRGGLAQAGGHEWSDEDGDPADPDVWLRTNPGVGYSLRLQRIAQEWEVGQRNPRSFTKERLGRWPEFSVLGKAIEPDLYRACLDPDTPHPPPGTFVAYALDVEYDRTAATLAASWKDPGSGDLRTAVVQHAPDVGKILARLPDIIRRSCDPESDLWQLSMRPSRDVREPFDRVSRDPRLYLQNQQRPNVVEQVSWAEYSSACAGLATAIKEQSVRLAPSAAMAASVMDAVPKMDRDGGWVFNRGPEAAPNSSLVAAAISLWSLHRALSSASDTPAIW